VHRDFADVWECRHSRHHSAKLADAPMTVGPRCETYASGIKC
jgi:hypothetical protein